MKLFTKKKHDCTVSKVLLQDKYLQPIVYIDYFALLKMQEYVNNTDKEIGWLGKVEATGNREYHIVDVDLIEQEVSNVTTELAQEGLQKYAEKLIAEGKVDDLNKIRCWGHSHVNMDVSPSSQDEETFEEYYKECSYFIRIIANKKEDLRLDIVERESELRFDHVDWKIKYPKELMDLVEELNYHTEQTEKIEKKFEQYNENALKTVKEAVKKEIEQNVKEEKRYKTYSYKDYRGSYYDTERKKKENAIDEDECVCLCENNIPTVPIYIKTEYEMQLKINEVFSDDEITLITTICKTGKDIRDNYNEDMMFEQYEEKDWDKLLNACLDYEYLVEQDEYESYYNSMCEYYNY